MATQHYVAQIYGYTKMGTVAEIQTWWDKLKAEHDFVGGVQAIQQFLGLQAVVAALCFFLYISKHFVDFGPEKTVEVLGFEPGDLLLVFELFFGPWLFESIHSLEFVVELGVGFFVHSLGRLGFVLLGIVDGESAEGLWDVQVGSEDLK